ncbi:MAG TPA: YceI family protein [Niabella sp.]|nr:YceI family protein [Niabella sp.]HOZ96193.1 YceI family protein [Niabella sp.]HQW13558.1 YceI family protein [Niabella sp.]HQX18952.1 YceI family protein [Niabella sp.]HQX40457.1 YceI family protein [Niabella sp.]
MTTWTIDSAHSEVGFKVKHLVISNVSGKFKSFEGTVLSKEDDFSDAQISFSLDIDSIDTGVDQRDVHLKSADFFDAEAHPKMSFKSTSIEKDGGELKITGDFTIKNTTNSVTLKVELGGVQKDMYGRTIAGFELNGKINRKAFGLTWSAVTEAGGVVVGDDVKLLANIELVKAA